VLGIKNIELGIMGRGLAVYFPKINKDNGGTDNDVAPFHKGDAAKTENPW